MRGDYIGIDNLELDLPSQVEYNRQKNVAQDQQIANLNSQINQIIEQTPSGFLPKVYYGLTRGAQTYRFIAENVFNVTMPGIIGSAYELYSSAESDNDYIPAVVVQINSDQIQVVIQGDYRVNTNTFDAVNTTDGSSTSITLSSPLTLQDASYLGQFNAQDEKSKQITVLNNLETGAKNVVFASIDYNNDGTFNWVEIGGFTNGKDGKSIYSVLSATYSTIVGLVKDGDLLFFAEDVTVGADNYYLGDVYEVVSAGPLTLSLQGNIRGPQGVQGVQGNPGTNGTNGDTPYIVSGNWWISGTDTGVRAYGHDGADGVNGQAFNMQSGFYSTPANYGQPGNDGPEGETLLQLPTLPQPDISGKGYIAYDPLTTPLYPFYDLYYANNGDVSWTVMHPFNGMKGQDGADGETPYIQSGNWYIGGVDTGVPATGSTGATGATGADGIPCLYVAANLSTSTDTIAKTSFSPSSFQSRIAVGNTVISQNGYLATVSAVSSTTVTTTFVKSLIGPQGSTGATGATPNISVTATQLSLGSTPTATRSGTDANPIITFGIPSVTAADLANFVTIDTDQTINSNKTIASGKKLKLANYDATIVGSSGTRILAYDSNGARTQVGNNGGDTCLYGIGQYPRFFNSNWDAPIGVIRRSTWSDSQGGVTFTNGLQICWGTNSTGSSSNFKYSFSSTPCVVVCGVNAGWEAVNVDTITNSSVKTNHRYSGKSARYVAFGYCDPSSY